MIILLNIYLVSSRSQCIINIRSNSKISDLEEDAQASSAVLTIIDLAGAEREKRTGNQVLIYYFSNICNLNKSYSHILLLWMLIALPGG